MVKDKAFLLIGSENAGKTETIRGWCNLKGYELSRGFNIFETKIEGKEELIIISSCSPQELSKYNLSNINELLSKRVRDYRKITKDKGFERFIWIMAFTVGITEGKVKKEEVTEAISLLENFKPTKIYIKRTDIEKFEEIDTFVNGIKDEMIISKEEYEQQAKELDEIIMRVVVKTPSISPESS